MGWQDGEPGSATSAWQIILLVLSTFYLADSPAGSLQLSHGLFFTPPLCIDNQRGWANLVGGHSEPRLGSCWAAESQIVASELKDFSQKKRHWLAFTSYTVFWNSCSQSLKAITSRRMIESSEFLFLFLLNTGCHKKFLHPIIRLLKSLLAGRHQDDKNVTLKIYTFIGHFNFL